MASQAIGTAPELPFQLRGWKSSTGREEDPCGGVDQRDEAVDGKSANKDLRGKPQRGKKTSEGRRGSFYYNPWRSIT